VVVVVKLPSDEGRVEVMVDGGAPPNNGGALVLVW
jgi:hypothetical protein